MIICGKAIKPFDSVRNLCIIIDHIGTILYFKN